MTNYMRRVGRTKVEVDEAMQAQARNFVDRVTVETEDHVKALRMERAKDEMNRDAEALAFAQHLDAKAEEFAERLRNRHRFREHELPEEMLDYRMEHHQDMHIVPMYGNEDAATREHPTDEQCHDPENTGMDAADEWLLREELRRICAPAPKKR